MAVITVTGEIRADKLGLTIPHEHVFYDFSRYYRKPPPHILKILKKRRISLEKITFQSYGFLMRDPSWSRANRVSSDAHYPEVREELKILKAAGARSLIDPTDIGIGRNPLGLKKLSKELGMNFITATGYYLKFYHPAEVAGMSMEEILERMLREITVGIGDTGVRAGLMGELGASGWDIPRDEKKVLVAAGRAQKKTGAPVMVHANQGIRTIRAAMKILEKNGANPEKINICHVNHCSYWKEVVRTGAYIGIDSLGAVYNWDSTLAPCESDARKLENLKRIADAGYIGKVLLSNDLCMRMRLHKFGGWGYDHILTNLAPYMKKEGITEKGLRMLFYDNPQKFLDM
jgi:phosphotriesterase-related protein